MPTPLAQAFIRIRPDTKGFQQEAQDGFDRAGRQAGEGFGESFNRELKNNQDKVEDSGKKAGKGFGEMFKDAISTAAGQAMEKLGEQTAEKLSAGFESVLNLGAANSMFEAQLGVTKQKAAEIGKLAGKIFAANYGGSMEEVQTAITSVIQNMDGMKNASNETLTSITEDALNVASVMGEDVSAVTRSVSQLLRTRLAPDAKAAFDIIFKSQQNGANAAGDLLDTIDEYSTQFREVGLSGPKAFGLIGQALRAGARDADTAADAIKEFAIRSKTAGDPNTIAGFKALHLNVKNTAKVFAQGGPAADKMFKVVIGRLKAMKDPIKQDETAVALFGTKAEDLQDALFALDPSTAVKSMGDLKGAADRANTALGDNAAAKLETFKRSMQLNVTNFIVEEVVPRMEDLGKALSGAGVTQGGVAAAVVPMVGLGVAAKVTSVAVNGVKSAITGIGAAASGVKSAINATQRMVSGFRSAQAAESAFSGRAGTFGGKLRTAFDAGVRGAKAAGTAMLSAGKAAATAALNVGKAAVAYTRQGLAAAAAALRTVAATVAQKAAALAAKAWALAQVALNFALSANPIGLVVIAVAALVAAIVIAYKNSQTFRNIVQGAFSGVAVAGRFMWSVLQVVFRAIMLYVNLQIAYFKLLWNVAKLVWRGISTVVTAAYNVIKPIIGFAIRTYIRLLMGEFKLFLAAVKFVWSGIRNATSSAWGFVSGIFGRFKSGVAAMGTAFSRGASAIGSAWSTIKSKTKDPVNFVIGTVFNTGIVGLWNKVMGWLHLPESLRLDTVPKLASGGPMPIKPGVFNKPTAIVGEGNPRYPEYVIPTDPKYRSRALGLWSSAGSQMQMMQIGGILGSVKGFASKVVNLGKDALDLIANPGAIWDKLVGRFVPSAGGLATSPFGQAMAAVPKMILDQAKGYAVKLFKAFGSGYGGSGGAVVKAALSHVGEGDDQGPNNNKWTREWGMVGAPWCAIFVSEMIKEAKAGKRYPGSPSAAVASFVGAMKHVGTDEGRKGDLAAYRGTGHINIIVDSLGGGTYDTVGGNQNSLVQHGSRSGMTSILRPLAQGGFLSPAMFSQVFRHEARRTDDRHEPTPLMSALGSMPRGKGMRAFKQIGKINTGVYDSGGPLPRGFTLAYNGTSGDEWVVPGMASGGVFKSIPAPRRQSPRAKAFSGLAGQVNAAAFASLDKINSFFVKLATTIKKYFTGAAEKKMLGWAAGVQKAMQKAATQAAVIADKIAKAKEFASGVTSSAKEFASVQNLPVQYEGKDIATSLGGRAKQLTDFANQIAALRKRGLSQDILSQVISQGAGEGGILAGKLLASDEGTFKKINAAQAAVNKAAGVLGNTAANAMFDSGKNAAGGFLAGLYAQQKALNKLMEALAARLVAGIRNAGRGTSSKKAPKLQPLFDDGGFGVGWPFHPRKPEAVFTQRQFADISRLVAMGPQPLIGNMNVTGLPQIPAEKQLVNAMERSVILSGSKWRR